MATDENEWSASLNGLVYIEVETERFRGLVGPFQSSTAAGLWTKAVIQEGSVQGAQVTPPHNAARTIKGLS